ncbi:MAG: hypothetical protein LBD75_06105 [Candidatus Peribacteria bacterium]|nr:hypothetical protein [Candidatus Peribacteria bacterium]
MKRTTTIYNFFAFGAFQNYCPRFLKNPIRRIFRTLFGTSQTVQWFRHIAGAIVDPK